MAIKLTILDSRNIDEVYSRTFVQNKVTIGRARHCDVCLPDLSVSTSHCEVRLMGTDYCLLDMGSLNGTLVGQKQLVAHRPKRLSNRDEFSIAHYQITFKLGVSMGPISRKTVAQEQALEMLDSVLSMAPTVTNPALVVVAGPSKASRFELAPAPSVAVIGRSRQCEIRLDDDDASRNHAEITYEDDVIMVRDLGSRNGVLIGGVLKKEFVLEQGCSFTIGRTTLALEHPLDPRLLEIQCAPEEETASYCGSIIEFIEKENIVNDKDSNTASKQVSSSKDTIAPSVSSMVSPQASSCEKLTSLPIGPEDPLLAQDTTDYIKTQEFQVVGGGEKSDWGLIVIGAIVVILCVLLLIWLLT